MSHYTAKDGARKNWQFCTRKLSGIFVPLSGRICARDFCPTIWTYIANRKIFRDFCPTILPKMAPEKIDNFVPENFQGFLFHYLGVFVPGTSVPLSGRIRIWFQENFQRFCVPLYCQRWRPKKLTILYQNTFRDFCPTIWAYLCQGLLSHYLDVYRQRWRRKNGQFGSRKIFRDLCPTIWAYIGEDGVPRMDIWF